MMNMNRVSLCLSWLLLAGLSVATELPAGWRVLHGQGAPGEKAFTIADKSAIGRSEPLAPGLYELTVQASGSGRLTLAVGGVGTQSAPRTMKLYDMTGTYGLLFAVEGQTATMPVELRVEVAGGQAAMSSIALQPATAEQQALWKDAEASFVRLGYYGTDPQRLAPAAPQSSTTEAVKPDTMRERVVFYDDNYDSHWVDEPEKVAAFFTARGFVPKGAVAIARWMAERVQTDTAVGTSATFVMGVAPTLVVNKPFADCPLAQYLRAGGRVVWLANVPMFVAQDEMNPVTMFGDEPREQMLGLSMPDRKCYYGCADAPTYTAAAKTWGLEPGLGLVRPSLNRGLGLCFVMDPAGAHCGVGLVNFRADVPLSGFIFVPNAAKPSDEPLLRNVYRLATYAGAPIEVPAAPAPSTNPVPVTAELRFGDAGGRTCFLRSETVPVKLRITCSAPQTVTVSVTLRDGKKTLAKKEVPVSLTAGEQLVPVTTLAVDRLRMGVYPVAATITTPTGVVHCEQNLSVCPLPDHDGTHVAVWLGMSPKARRTENVLEWLKREQIEPMFVDSSDYARDRALWHGLSFSVRRHGSPTKIDDPAGYDSFRYGSGGETMRMEAVGGKRGSVGYASPVRRQAEADDFGKQIADDARFPAFRQRAVTGDDYSQWFGLDYNRYVVEGFKKKSGMDVPRPKGTEDPTSTPNVDHPKGIIPDDEPWLLLNRYWSEDVLGDMGHKTAEQIRRATGGAGKVGPIPGGMQLPVMQMWSAQYPPLNFGPKGFNLTCFYYYNCYWQPQLAHLWWLESARMGNRDQEQWIMPDCYVGGDQASYFRNNGWLMLAGGATGLEYFVFDNKTPVGTDAMSFFGELSHRYGRLLAEIKPTRKQVGVLVPLEQIVYRIENCYEMAYGYMNLLLAKVDAEPVSPMELTPENIRQYEAIVLTQMQWLTKRNATLLTDYVKAGGQVIIDAASAKEIDIPGAIHLKLPLAEPYIGGYGQPEKIVAVRQAIEPYVKPVVDCDDAFTVIRRFAGNGRNYLWVIHNPTGEEYMAIRSHQATPDKFGYGQTVITITLTLADDGSIPYDVFTGKPLPTTRADGRMRVTVKLPKSEGTLVALLPAAPVKLRASRPKFASHTKTVSLTLTVQGRTGPVPALFPLHVTVTDPRGETNREYARRLLARDGQATYTITFAENDLAGRWRFTATDALTGLKTTWSVKL